MIDFADFKNEALATSNSEEEKKRVSEEIELFISRGWEKYVMLVVNTIRELNLCGFDFPYEFAGSARDSFTIRLLTTGVRDRKSFLRDERKKGVLFNDAFRFSILIHEMYAKENPKFGIKLNEILESNIKELGLKYTEYLLDGKNPLPYGSPDTKDNLIIVSDNIIPEIDASFILTETKDGREGETEILHKYLLLKVSMFGGI